MQEISAIAWDTRKEWKNMKLTTASSLFSVKRGYTAIVLEMAIELHRLSSNLNTRKSSVSSKICGDVIDVFINGVLWQVGKLFNPVPVLLVIELQRSPVKTVEQRQRSTPWQNIFQLLSCTFKAFFLKFPSNLVCCNSRKCSSPCFLPSCCCWHKNAHSYLKTLWCFVVWLFYIIPRSTRNNV